MGVPVLLRVPALAVLFFLTLAVPAFGQADYANKQADRQLEFAREELANGDYERALRSAESSLRLTPDYHPAMLLKAQAYEGLEDYPLAETTLLAYLEMAPPTEQDPLARIALERVRAKIEDDAASGSRSRNARLRKSLTEEDIKTFRERVTTNLAAGLCQSARSAAKELTLAAPDVAEGWKLAGDAARCASNTREAAISYRRYQYLGGSDSSVLELIDALSESLATLVVDVADTGSGITPILHMSVAGSIIEPLPAEGGRLGFYDLPTGSDLTLNVQGDGIETEEVSIERLTKAETRTLALTPKVVGHGKLRAAEYDKKVFGVWVTGDEEPVALAPGKALRLTATTVLMRIRTDLGKLDVPVAVVRDSEVVFDPNAHQPAALTVVNLPSGGEASIRMVDGDPLEQRRDLPITGARREPETKVLVSQPQKFKSLRGGTATLSVKHPTLGSASQEVLLLPGEVNATTFDPRQLTGLAREAELLAAKQEKDATKAAAEAKAREEAEAEKAARREQQAIQNRPDLSVKKADTKTIGIVLSAVGGAFLAGGIGAFGYSGYARNTANSWDQYGTSFGLSEQDSADRLAAENAANGSIGAGVGFAVLGGISLPLGIILATKKKK
ncbi:MAG: tetratricopeptide repeat protein [Deltaproteobacteria bacterium]|nr:tetratricopeptide repeat protein [Deltaproteobacteria bacterium]